MNKHIADDDCFCHPTPIPVEKADGEIMFVMAHNEENMPVEKQADRCVVIFEAMDSIKHPEKEN